jgi:4-diphosphocytidyl-2-C-methyl-D-erythritol kinase
LLHFHMPARRLEKLAASIGADVPFFIQARPARARGIGDRLTPLMRVPSWWLIILYPGFPVSTSWVYKNLRCNLTKSRPNTSISTLLSSAPKFPDLLVNDLEAVTIKRHPRVGLLKETLLELGAEGALMTGSGSSVFGIFGSRVKANNAYRTLRRTNDIQAFLAQVIGRPKELPNR